VNLLLIYHREFINKDHLGNVVVEIQHMPEMVVSVKNESRDDFLKRFISSIIPNDMFISLADDVYPRTLYVVDFMIAIDEVYQRGSKHVIKTMEFDIDIKLHQSYAERLARMVEYVKTELVAKRKRETEHQRAEYERLKKMFEGE
jgi:hypothetical protein